MKLLDATLTNPGGDFKNIRKRSSIQRQIGRLLETVSVVLFVIVFALPLLAGDPSRPNVLLITLDTMRADHVSCYGYHLRTTPMLDRLAQEGTRFAWAYTAIPLTGPAHVSLFTARYPQEHGSKVNGQPLADDPRLVTLAEILKRHGYGTAAYVSAWTLKKRLTRLHPGFELYDQHFSRKYQLFNSYRTAADVTPQAIQWLRNVHREPFFLWVHYFDPHKPYLLRADFADLPRAGESALRNSPENSEMAERIRRYDSEVAYMDHYIGKLLGELARLGIGDSTLVIVVGDHGESLGERDYVGHGRHLFESIVRVPLIMRLPGLVPAGRVVPQDVSILDVMPTVLDLLDIDYPLPLQGKTLRPLLGGGDGAQSDTTYFLTFPGKKWQAPKWLSWLWYHDSTDRLPLKLGRIRDRQKIVWTPGSDNLEVFDLGEDRTRMRPLFSGEASGPYKDEVERMHSWFKATTLYRDEKHRLRQRDIEILRSLGYVGK